MIIFLSVFKTCNEGLSIESLRINNWYKCVVVVFVWLKCSIHNQFGRYERACNGHNDATDFEIV